MSRVWAEMLYLGPLFLVVQAKKQQEISLCNALAYSMGPYNHKSPICMQTAAQMKVNHKHTAEIFYGTQSMYCSH